MRGFPRALLLSLGLVLSGVGCLAGPQPDPPSDNPDRDRHPGARQDAGRGPPLDPAPDSGPSAPDAGTAPPAPANGADGQFEAGLSDDSDAEEVRREERRDNIWRPEDRIIPVVPLVDAGPAPDAGDDEGDDAAQGM